MKKVLLIAGTLVFVFLSAASAFAQGEKGEDYIVGKVGRDEIHISEIDALAQKLNRFLLDNYKTNKEWRYNFIRNYIAQIALAKRAEREGLGRDEKIAEELEQMKVSLLAEKILKDTVSRQLKGDEKSLRDFYEENRGRYQINAQLKLSYTKSKNKNYLERVISLMAKGRSLKKSAGKKAVEIKPWISKDSYTAPEFPEFLSPQVLSRLEALEKGSNSAVIEIEGEFYVFYVEDKKPVKYKTFEEVRRQVELEYATREKERIVTDLVIETFEKEKVEIYEDKILKMGVK